MGLWIKVFFLHKERCGVGKIKRSFLNKTDYKVEEDGDIYVLIFFIIAVFETTFGNWEN